MHPLLCTGKDCRSLIVTTQTNSTYVFDLSGEAEPYDIKSSPIEKKQVDLIAKGVILAAAVSPSKKYLVLCDDYKQLRLYRINTDEGSKMELVSSRNTAKKAARIVYFKDESGLVMADKFGDVTKFSITEPEKEGDIILGHLSMLLDCTFLCDDKYIATADRDEKIRVSLYPDTFEIQSFCLGHTKYVTSLVEAETWLISGGGDGMVKLWNPANGDMLSEVTCSDDSKVVQQLIYLSDSNTVVCLLNDSKKIVYITLKADNKTAALNSEVTEHDLSAEGLAMCEIEGGVLVLVNDKSKPLHFISNGGKPEPKNLDKINDYLQSRWDCFDGTLVNQTDFFTNLTKMNSDNVEEEMERKGKRLNLSGSKEKNIVKMAKVSS